MVRLILKPLLVLSLGLIAPLAYGETLTAHSEYFIPANPNTGAPDRPGSVISPPSDTSASTNLDTTYSTQYFSIYSRRMEETSGLATRANAYVDNTGIIKTFVEGQSNSFNTSAGATTETTVTNNSGGDMHYYYTLNIPQSGVDAHAYSFYKPSEFSATNQFTVSINGKPIWDSSATLEMSYTGFKFITTGEDMGWEEHIVNNIIHWDLGYTGQAYMSLGKPYTNQIDLGVLAAGESFTLDYTILSALSAKNAYCNFSCYGVLAYIGDPSVLSTKPMFKITSNPAAPPNAVPVPAAVWLFGSGLLGLFGAQRRKG